VTTGIFRIARTRATIRAARAKCHRRRLFGRRLITNRLGRLIHALGTGGQGFNALATCAYIINRVFCVEKSAAHGSYDHAPKLYCPKPSRHRPEAEFFEQRVDRSRTVALQYDFLAVERAAATELAFQFLGEVGDHHRIRAR